MNIIIEIPKEFEAHFREDNFEDSLHRLSADAHLLAGRYEQEVAIMLIKAFKDCKVVADNGEWIMGRDMMYCSECAELYDKGYRIDYEYCPYCGAKMEEAEYKAWIEEKIREKEEAN